MISLDLTKSSEFRKAGDRSNCNCYHIHEYTYVLGIQIQIPPPPFIWDLIARPCAHDIAFKLNVVAAVME